jgi:sec-independent protein translocase protein TatC
MFNKFFSELKVRLIIVVLSWFIAAIISYLNKEVLLFIIIKPVLISTNMDSFYFIATNLTDVFSVYLKVVYLIANQITIFFLLWQGFCYITPALFYFEYKKLRFTLFLGLGLLCASIFLLNIYILPFCWQFFSSFQENPSKCVNVFLEIRITEYLDFYTFSYYVTVILSQGFLLTFLFLDMLQDKLVFIKKSRKIFYVTFFVLATIMTPPDVISQIILGCWLIFIYELIIVILILKKFSVVTN